MKELKIKPEMMTKVIQKGSIIIRVADLKPRQYAQVYKLGFAEIFEDEKGEKCALSSNKEIERAERVNSTMGGIQGVESKTGKTRSSNNSKNR